ncbi:hypothetical protein [Streptomyces sp. NBC_00140]|uniref:hypothetical protein n=1 Tax=Streptomyces sp. NBC_00140 TaxID=2975664 RepID=UPI002256404C|nr:hypothetical protein [Streptomyces sp. NBC_00140]MCX5328088.1 hypothetical protein [Streptomyces sp. NBC_00140]
MWSYDSLLGKARVYFIRGREHPQADNEVFALWLLLGLEFLLRAPLAKVHPTLLAEPDGPSILNAAGFPRKPNTRDPKSIPTHTVITRLLTVVEDFEERKDEATFLTGLRNHELHSGDSALSIDPSLWLPKFTRVTQVLCNHLGLTPDDLLGDEVVKLGKQLVDAEDKKISHEVTKRIAASLKKFEAIDDDAVTSLRASARPGPESQWEHSVNCPACESKAWPALEAVRRTNERFEDGVIYANVISIAKSLSCAVCGLSLSGPSEMKSAGLPQQFTHEEEDSIEDRYLDTYEPDYGND